MYHLETDIEGHGGGGGGGGDSGEKWPKVLLYSIYLLDKHAIIITLVHLSDHC